MQLLLFVQVTPTSDLISQEFFNTKSGFSVPISAILDGPYCKNDNVLVKIVIFLWSGIFSNEIKTTIIENVFVFMVVIYPFFLIKTNKIISKLLILVQFAYIFVLYIM